ncbi:FliH/SctL family protein [Clostridium formicaceticum]|uniref:Flagellar assembly protein FliH/Type III secretion system HrpE domain-containing protein n=1 Tax=Clostridium formicaceticum TaxID=1497 RepID=A0ABN4TEN2_9CLOT|nr:FliH/SctL family protein [Clostridium formicaceticum]AOY77320.1 hypothetical protein BJL90_16570 [Clostridium formicaceticum]
MYRVYKSMEVILGDKKELEFQNQSITKQPNPLLVEAVEQQETPEEIAEKKAKETLEAADLEGKKIIENARKEAAVIIEAAYEDSKKILEDAKAQGYQEGLQRGQQEGYHEFQQLMEEAVAAKQEVYHFRKKLVKELEEEIIDLVVYCVKKVIDYALEENNEILLNLVKKGLEKCTFTEKLVIRVSEEGYEVLNSYKNKIYMMLEGIDSIEIKSDVALKKGSIIIETLSGKVDASIDVQIKQIETLFEEILRSEESHERNHA